MLRHFLGKETNKLPFVNIYFLLLDTGAYSTRLCCLRHNKQHTSQEATDFSVESGVPQGSMLRPVLFNSLVGAMDKGNEGTLNKVADDTKMSAVLDTLEGRDPIQRYLAQ